MKYKNPLKVAALWFIRIYQKFISPFFPRRCRYIPTCSTYTVNAIEKYGVIRGSWMGAQRIGRCHPWSNHNMYDPVEK